MSDGAAEGTSKSFVRWEEPDILFTAYIGAISGGDMRELIDEGRRIYADKPFFFSILDMSGLRSVSGDARTLARDEGRDLKMRAAAIFGASYHLRVLAVLVDKATKLLYRERAAYRIAFFGSEAEARAFVDEQRVLLSPRA